MTFYRGRKVEELSTKGKLCIAVSVLIYLLLIASFFTFFGLLYYRSTKANHAMLQKLDTNLYNENDVKIYLEKTVPEFFQSIANHVTDEIVDSVYFEKNIEAIDHAYTLMLESLDELDDSNYTLKSNSTLNWVKKIAYDVDEGIHLNYHSLDVNYDKIIRRKAEEYERIFRNSDSSNPQCGVSYNLPKETSNEQAVIDMYFDVANSQIKYYAVLQFAEKYLESIDEEIDENKLKNQYEKLLQKLATVKEKLLKILKDYNYDLSRDIWKCDPPRFTDAYRNSYGEVKAFKKVIVRGSERDFHIDTSCFYNNTTTGQDYYRECCNGTLYDCEAINDYTYCPIDVKNDESPLASKLAYLNYFTRSSFWDFFGKEYIYGSPVKNCELVVKRAEPDFFCTCNIRGPHNVINLTPQVADVDENKVLTGVRLVHENGMYSIQIQQGVALTAGFIDEKTIEWKEISYSNDSSFVVNPNSSVVFLEDHDLPDAIVTGITFSKINYLHDCEALTLNVRSNMMDFDTGKVDNKTSLWTKSRNDAGKEIDLSRKSAPVSSIYRDSKPYSKVSIEKSQFSRYLRFQLTDLISDVGQNTIPYLDLQPVVIEPAFVISGAGLYHKGGKSSGGFLGLSLKTYKFDNYSATGILNSMFNVTLSKIPKFELLPFPDQYRNTSLEQCCRSRNIL